MPFGTSAFVHGLLLGCLLAARVQPMATPASLSDRGMKPYTQHIIWYRLREKLPDVSPSKSRRDGRPLRARVRFQQNLVAGDKDLATPPQLIRLPAPKIELPKMLALPNVLAVSPPPPPLRPFQAPPTVKAKPPSAAPELPDAPRLTAALPPKVLPFDVALPKPQPRAFAPPPTGKAPVPAALPELPTAPELHAAAAALAPPSIPHGFTAPPPKLAIPEQADDAPPPAPATLAIVGLNPAKGPDFPPPPASHDAAFSGGPEVHPLGASETPTESAAVTVPGLVARGGAKDATGSLMSVFAPLSQQRIAAALSAASPGAVPPPIHSEPLAAHVSSAPDPRLKGRYIYTMAIQMPNVTSYSGSWIVWFADRDPVTGAIAADLRPPVPTRKVDPKYIQTAVEERVQGVVRLAAVIRRDGHVQSVELLQRLDERLDRTAVEALSKWEFEPALRDGVPVEVDAVFEIPFRLAPRTSR